MTYNYPFVSKASTYLSIINAKDWIFIHLYKEIANHPVVKVENEKHADLTLLSIFNIYPSRNVHNDRYYFMSLYLLVMHKIFLHYQNNLENHPILN